MGWDEMSRVDYPCPCGKSTYTRVVEMDDWNRYRESRIMHCPYCAEKEKEERARIREESERLSKLEKEIKAYFAVKYLKEWLAYFEKAKNKKQTWELARKLGVETYSLSAFYSHKYSSMETYIESLATYYNMDKIMHVLNINDRELTSKVEEAMRLRENEKSRIINEWYNRH